MNDIYAAFSEQLQRAQQGQVDLLDEDDGLLSRWAQLCDAQSVPACPLSVPWPQPHPHVSPTPARGSAWWSPSSHP